MHAANHIDETSNKDKSGQTGSSIADCIGTQPQVVNKSSIPKEIRHFHAGRVAVHEAECLSCLRTFPDAVFDSVVTDPPYALVSIVKRFGDSNAAPCKVKEGGTGAYARASSGFMGQTWDTGETAFAVEFWSEVLRVLKPGGHVVAFSGTRTYHRLAVAIEDSGFEIRDQLGWCYGTGFPKSHNIAKALKKLGMTPEQVEAWEGWGTALKPAWEPICLARRPLIGTVAGNVLAHGVGALNIDGCRVGFASDAERDAVAAGVKRMANSKRGEKEATHEGWVRPWMDGTGQRERMDRMAANQQSSAGRFPANLVHDGSDEVEAAFAAFGESTARPAKAILAGGASGSGKKGQSTCYGGGREYLAKVGYDDAESNVSRFFYSAKAGKLDRLGSKHPTVKPVDLMRWLVRLVTPPGGAVLDPFAGSGTTGHAAVCEGMRAVLIEREAKFCQDIAQRMERMDPNGLPKKRPRPKPRPADPWAGTLFAKGSQSKVADNSCAATSNRATTLDQAQPSKLAPTHADRADPDDSGAEDACLQAAE